MAQSKEAMDHEKSKEVLETLHKMFECQVCLSVVQKDFILCTSGHLICEFCCIRVIECPLCKGKLDMKNPIVLKKLAETLPNTCKYQQHGCKETVTPEDQLQHEKYCKFRLVYCHLVYKQPYTRPVPDDQPRLQEDPDGRIISCKNMIPLCQLEEHYETAHPKDSFFKSDRNRVTLKGQFEFKWGDEQLILPFFTPDNVFWLICSNKRYKNLKIILAVSPIGTPKDEPFVRLCFKKGPFVDTRTMEPKFERGQCSLQEKSKNRVCVLVIHPCRYKNVDGSLSFWVNTFFEEKEIKGLSLFEKFKKTFFFWASHSMPNNGQ